MPLRTNPLAASTHTAGRHVMSTKTPRPKRSPRGFLIVHRTKPVIYRHCRRKADVADTLAFFAAAGCDVLSVPPDFVWTGGAWRAQT